MGQLFKLHFCVPPGYKHLIAELYYNAEHFGELNTESSQLDLVLFSRPAGDAWNIRAEDAISCLQDARSQFMSRSTFFK
jgi:hypothetical protein